MMARTRDALGAAWPMIRAGLCLGVPLAAGLLTGQRMFFTLCALGALWGVSQDGSDAWRTRTARLGGVAATSATGVLIGALVSMYSPSSIALAAAIGVTALVAGWIETAQRNTPAGMHLLLGVIVGGGMGIGAWPAHLDRIPLALLAALAVAAGALLPLLAAVPTDRRTRDEQVRNVVADAYAGLARQLAAHDGAAAATARAGVITAMDVAQEMLAGHGHSDARLRRCFMLALAMAEYAATARPLATDAEAPEPVRLAWAHRLSDAATALRSGDSDNAARILTISEPDGPVLPATDDVWALPAPRPAITPRERIRFALLLGLGCAAAAMIGTVLHGPRAYWLPMTVAFIMRPDVGPLARRGVARTAGTVAGVLVAALLTAVTHSGYALLAVATVCAAIMPWAARRGHAYLVGSFTPIVFVFLSVLGQNHHVLFTRIIDTAIGAAIVLLLDLVWWARPRTARPVDAITAAETAAERYAGAPGSSGAHAARHELRREAFHSLAIARAEVDASLREPYPSRWPDPWLIIRLDQVENRIDAATAAHRARCAEPTSAPLQRR